MASTETPILAAAASEVRNSSFVSAAGWTSTGNIASQGLTQAGVLVAARLLGVEEFGKFSLIWATLNTFAIFGSAGPGLTVARYVSQTVATDPDRCGRMISFCRLLAIGMGAILAALTPLLPIEPGVRVPMLLCAPAVVMLAYSSVQVNLFAGLREFRQVAAVQWLRGLATFSGIAAGAMLDGVKGACCGLVLANMTAVALQERLLLRSCAAAGVRSYRRVTRDEWETLRQFSLPVMLASVLASPVLWLASMILLRSAQQYAEIARLNAAVQWRSLVMFLPAAATQASFPLLAAAQGLRRGEFRRIYGLTHFTAMAIVFPAAAGLMFSAPIWMRIYGKGFEGAIEVFAYSMCAAMIMSLGMATGMAWQACGRAWLNFGINALWAALTIGGSLLLAPRMLALGVVVSFFFAYLTATLAVLVFAPVDVPKVVRRSCLAGLAWTCAAAAAFHYVEPWLGWASGLTAAIVTALSVWFGATPPEMRTELEQRAGVRLRQMKGWAG